MVRLFKDFYPERPNFLYYKGYLLAGYKGHEGLTVWWPAMEDNKDVVSGIGTLNNL